MKKFIISLIAISGLVVDVSLACAEDEPPYDKNMYGHHHAEMDEMMFKKLDTNGDGVISKKEFDAVRAAGTWQGLWRHR